MAAGRKIPREEWIARFRALHGDLYDYSEFVLLGAQEASVASCVAHGVFRIVPVTHSKGGKCPQCRKTEARKLKELEILSAVEKLYNGRIVVIELRRRGKSVFRCTHGIFEAHLSNMKKREATGCSYCVGQRKKDRIAEEMISRFRAVHGDRYDYSKTVYVDSSTPVLVHCGVHGPWKTLPGNHWSAGAGCPKCSILKSKEEEAWIGALEVSLGQKAARHYSIKHQTNKGSRYSADGVFGNVAVDYDGEYWHGKPEAFEKDSKKTLAFIGEGFTMIRLRVGKLEPIPHALCYRVNPSPQSTEVERIAAKIVEVQNTQSPHSK